MTSFAGSLDQFVRLVENVERDAFVSGVEECHRSIVDGSELTGAPGQRVDTGYMKGSWIIDFISETLARITTNVSYAPVHEYDDRSAFNPEGEGRPEWMKSTKAPEPGAGEAIPSEVGGPHSVAHTVAGWPRILEFVTRPSNRTEAAT